MFSWRNKKYYVASYLELSRYTGLPNERMRKPLVNECETIRETFGQEFDDSKKGKQTLIFLCFMSDINVFRKLFKKRGLHSTAH